jgi:hypothetical protein
MTNSRRKGATAELAVTHIGQASGFAVTKRSGLYVAGHDLDWPLLGIDRRVEIKRHAAGQSRLYAWLAPVYCVIHRGDRREWLVTLRLSDALEIAKAAERRR